MILRDAMGTGQNLVCSILGMYVLLYVKQMFSIATAFFLFFLFYVLRCSMSCMKGSDRPVRTGLAEAYGWGFIPSRADLTPIEHHFLQFSALVISSRS